MFCVKKKKKKKMMRGEGEDHTYNNYEMSFFKKHYKYME